MTSRRWSALVPAFQRSCTTVEGLKQLWSVGQITDSGRQNLKKIKVVRENESVNMEDHVPRRFERRVAAALIKQQRQRWLTQGIVPGMSLLVQSC
jgi:primosomal replication protein N